MLDNKLTPFYAKIQTLWSRYRLYLYVILAVLIGWGIWHYFYLILVLILALTVLSLWLWYTDKVPNWFLKGVGPIAVKTLHLDVIGAKARENRHWLIAGMVWAIVLIVAPMALWFFDRPWAVWFFVGWLMLASGMSFWLMTLRFKGLVVVLLAVGCLLMRPFWVIATSQEVCAMADRDADDKGDLYYVFVDTDSIHTLSESMIPSTWTAPSEGYAETFVAAKYPLAGMIDFKGFGSRAKDGRWCRLKTTGIRFVLGVELYKDIKGDSRCVDPDEVADKMPECQVALAD